MSKRKKQVDWGLTLRLIPAQLTQHVYQRYFLNRLGLHSALLLPGPSGLNAFDVYSFMRRNLGWRIFAVVMSVLTSLLYCFGSVPLLLYTNDLDRYWSRGWKERLFIVGVTWLLVWSVRNTVWMIRHLTITPAQFKARYGTGTIRV